MRRLTTMLLFLIALNTSLPGKVSSQNDVFLPDLQPITNENAPQVRELYTQVSPKEVRTVQFNIDGSLLAVGNWFAPEQIWQIEPLQVVSSPPYSISVCDVQFSPDSSLVVFSDWERSSYVWDIAANQEVLSIVGTGGNSEHVCNYVAFNSNDLMAYILQDTLHLWNITTRNDVAILDKTATQIMFSPDGQSLAVALEDGMIEIWDTSLRTLQRTLSGHTSNLTSWSFSSDSTQLVAGDYDWNIILWNIQEGTVLHQLVSDDHYTEGIAQVSFSPNGDVLAFHGASTVTVLDVNDWEVRASYPYFTRPTSMDFIPDSSLLVFGTLAGTLNIWNYDTGETYTLEGHSANWMDAVDISPNDLLIATGSEDGALSLWGVPSGN